MSQQFLIDKYKVLFRCGMQWKSEWEKKYTNRFYSRLLVDSVGIHWARWFFRVVMDHTGIKLRLDFQNCTCHINPNTLSSSEKLVPTGKGRSWAGLSSCRNTAQSYIFCLYLLVVKQPWEAHWNPQLSNAARIFPTSGLGWGFWEVDATKVQNPGWRLLKAALFR